MSTWYYINRVIEWRCKLAYFESAASVTYQLLHVHSWFAWYVYRPLGLGIHIRQIPCAHVTCVMIACIEIYFTSYIISILSTMTTYYWSIDKATTRVGMFPAFYISYYVLVKFLTTSLPSLHNKSPVCQE